MAAASSSTTASMSRPPVTVRFGTSRKSTYCRATTPEDDPMTSLHLERARDDFERRRPIDVRAVEVAARELLTTLGVDLDDETLQETPERMARAYVELLTPEPFTATTFPNDDEYDDLVLARSI